MVCSIRMKGSPSRPVRPWGHNHWNHHSRPSWPRLLATSTGISLCVEQPGTTSVDIVDFVLWFPRCLRCHGSGDPQHEKTNSFAPRSDSLLWREGQ